MIKSRKVRWLISITILGVALVIAFVSLYPAPNTPLVELKALDDLRDQFNRDRGQPRLILLLSPT